MTISADGCMAPAVSSTVWPSTALLVGGLLLLWVVVHKSESTSDIRSRRLGVALIGGAALCFAAGLVLSANLPHRSCGSSNAASAVVADLTMLSMALFMLGTALRTGSEWVAIAATVVVDGCLVLLLLGQSMAHRGEYLDILTVHAVCTATASHWSRAVRGAPRHLRTKASEAGRVLAGGWIIIIAVAFAGLGDPGGADTFLTDTMWIGLFIGGAIAAVLGTGYTKYAEVRHELENLPAPPADLLTGLGRGLPAVVGMLRSWHSAYRDCF